MKESVRFDLPPALSTLAEQHDWIFSFLFWVSVFFFVAITGTVVYFALRYRRRNHPKAEPTPHNMALELTWTFTPLLLLAFLFYKGMQGFMYGMVAPEDAVEIHATARQWAWDFRYPGGGETTGELVVPVGRPVKIVLNSVDVVHSFYIPEFRVKRDAVPGMYTMVWFQATKEGEAHVFCAEYCGAPAGAEGNQGHSAMLAKVRIVSEAEFQKFLEENSGGMPAQCKGQPNPDACWGKLIAQKKGCFACHGTDGKRQQPAPNWKGLWGSQRTLTDGRKVTFDENHVRESILRPRAKVTKGYNPIMPPFKLKDEQIDAIIAYMKSLK